MTKDEQLLINRILDLAGISENNGYCTFSDFLNLNEQTIFFDHKELFLGRSYEIFGGYDDAERRMIKFYQDYCVEEPYPIVCVKIEPVIGKFSDTLTHRDFLGAVLNLGVDRGKIGDILIHDNIGYMFCKESISEFLIENLVKIKHTKVRAKISQVPEIAYEPHFKTRQGTVTSIRVDSLLALAFNLSRSSAVKYISQGLVFINGRLVVSNSQVPKDGDIISVRKLGRFKLELTAIKSKKDKFVVKTHVYN